MAEIKTCEQYVLSRLQEQEWTNEALNEQLMALQKDYDEQAKKLFALETLFTKYVSVRTFGEGSDSRYLKVEDIDAWRKESKMDFDYLVNTFGLKTEEEKNASTSN